MKLTWFLDVPELRRALGVILVLALGAFLLFPLATLVIWAFADVWRYPNVLPQSFSFRWWQWVFANGDVGKAVFYSVTTAPVVTVLSALICLPAAYSFSRLQFPGRSFLFISLLAANAFPKFGLYISIATIFFELNLINTFWGVVLIQLINTLVVMVWIPAAGFDSVPRALEEAARDAGAGPLRVFWRITLPIAMPGIIVAGILAFLAAFDESQGTLVVGSPTITTMPILMYTLVSNYPEPVGAVFSILLSIPSLVLLLVARRYLIAGYLAAGFKGR
ncbi:MAG TPA: carbohydrate ABC transporter permease [Chloroflexota bacterium]|nr:carbohydrate ABC transporter permease [Chloroflexota bacterium]